VHQLLIAAGQCLLKVVKVHLVLVLPIRRREREEGGTNFNLGCGTCAA